MSIRLAIDIGGTFTDLVLDERGQRHTTKVLTTPERPADGLMQGVGQILESSGIAAGAIDLVVHGTTLATNALIERKGARTALITTEGHRDTLEMAFENRFDQYDIQADRNPPLIGRELRFEVSERMSYRGEDLIPLDDDSVTGLIPALQAARIDSVAVGLLHAYANPAHEQRVAAILATVMPELSISLSSDVCPEIREYERQSTTVANAYVRPMIAGYLADLESRLADAGLRCPCLLMTSGGSLVTIETASRFPIRLVESGPAGGAILAAHMARQLGEDRLISFDMGGTTAKICLIDDGQPLLNREFEVDRAHRFMKGSGTPLKIPVIEMVEIGAGGGSIASVDRLDRIRIGPQSAGSDPGPACYARGGNDATVTDANLVLGRLDPAGFAGGTMALDTQAADQALTRHVGDKLALSPMDAARGMIEIVDENMASAARVHAAERGLDLEGRTMIAFGGGAPLHAGRLAAKLGIERIIVPADAGVGSAVGFLLAPVAYEVVRSQYVRLDDLDGGALTALFADMEGEATSIVRLAAPGAGLSIARHGYARYVGQGHEIKVELPEGPFDDRSGDAIRAMFEAAYEAKFGLLIPGMAIEVLTWSLTAVAANEAKAGIEAQAEIAQGDAAPRQRQICDPAAPDPIMASVVDRRHLTGSLHGAAAIEEAQTTTIVPAGWTATMNRSRDLILSRDAPGDTAHAGAGVAEKVRLQVLWDRLISVVEEQAQAIMRTAFSTSVREAGDLSAGIFAPDGRMLAQAVTGTPGHVNAMAASVEYFLEKYPAASMQPGDVYVTNDPWQGTGHLFDFTVVTPVFLAENLVGLFASTVHVVDIGGIGFSPDSGQIFEEGLCIPITKLFAAGKANDQLFEIVRANVREPAQVVGDLYSLASSNEVGVRRLRALMREAGIGDLDQLGEHIISLSRRAMQDAISRLPSGVYENSMTVDGYDKPVSLQARMEIHQDRITVDYAGSSGSSAFGINVPLTYARAYTSFGIHCIIGEGVPNNAGSLAAIEVTAPEGSILNAPRPCAVNVRHVIGQMLPDVVLGCLGKALPGGVPAEGSSSLWNPMLSGGHGVVGPVSYGDATPFAVTVFHAGGTGARPGKPGLSATAFPSGVRTTSVEITESIAPVIYRRKLYRDGSGGDGRWQGGDGQIIEIEHSQKAPFAVFALFDRIDNPARGREGGAPGLAGRAYLSDGTKLKGKGKQIIPPGRSLIMELPGGGGLGKPESDE
ncbi:MAG: methylhydantoinase [SAR116 cluster bacterium]|nr:methylhydantoinase [SAR116 cluster bacterium]RPH00955.1 MAG: methylhydantoinase [Candidatus Puniceispirillum sp. TMED176]